jgi:hypothetical protein
MYSQTHTPYVFMTGEISHLTQYQKAPTFAVSCESLKHHTYRKGAPL